MKFPRLAATAALVLFVAACSGDDIVGPNPNDTRPSEARKKGPSRPDTGGTITPPPTTEPPPAGANPFLGATFYVDPFSNARKTVTAWTSTRPADAAQMEKIASGSQAKWFGRWNSDVESDVRAFVATVATTGAMPVLVAYNIYQLNCTSAGPSSPEGYRSWIAAFARGLGAVKTAIVLEPDAIAAWGCLSTTDRATRAELLDFAIRTLKARPLTHVYVDAGHPRWQSTSEMAARLTSVGIAAADGFSLNVSNFIATPDNVTYGKAIAALIGGKHFVIDTARNGLGPTADYQWCNPSGRALGLGSSALTADPVVDAYLWIKPPGESDGTCNGGPAAGAWWADYALGLAQRS
jgi:endoglucanase